MKLMSAAPLPEMFPSRRRRCLLLMTILFVGAFVACGKYQEYNPPRTGVFYPNECVNLRGRKANGFLFRPDVFTVCQPVRISEVGVMRQYEPENAGNHEVARLEFSNGGYYVWTSTLQQVGRIEYSDLVATESLWQKGSRGFWKRVRSAGNHVWSVIIVVFFVILFIRVIASA